jgi:hypothetical protein
MRAPSSNTSTMPLIRSSNDADLDTITTLCAHHVLNHTGMQRGQGAGDGSAPEAAA